MLRRVNFVEDEHFHLFSRGVEKRKIFLERKDYDRFLALMYILNQENRFHVSNFLNKGGHRISDLYEEERSNSLVSILAYSLMPNHFHIVIKEIIENGISTFMSRLLTAYSMYFNIKHERSGSLFVHPFRSEHISNERYFLWIFDYVHLNCLDLVEKGWKETGIKNRKKAQEFLENYYYSSYYDLYHKEKRPEAKIIDLSNIPDISRIILDNVGLQDFKAVLN